MSRKSLILYSVVALTLMALLFVLTRFLNSSRDIERVSSNTVAAYEPNNSVSNNTTTSSVDGEVTLADVLSELAKMREDMDIMQSVVSELQNQPNGYVASESVQNNDLSDLYRTYLNDPEGVAQKLGPYLNEHQQSVAVRTDTFFAELPDQDPSWNETSAAFINDSFVNSSIQNLASAQVNEATCKSGVCKVDLSLSSNNPEGFSDEELYEAENHMLIAMAKEFPNTRLKMIKHDDGRVSFQGYVNDGSVTLPKNEVDFNDPAVIEQISSALQ